MSRRRRTTDGMPRKPCAALFVGILAQSGGFFLHMVIGQPNQTSIGTAVTVTGAILLACAVVVLVYGMITCLE